jgi:hypothetical protein
VNLVVDHESPVECIEQCEVGVLALPLCGEDLVGRDGDRLHLFDLAGVLTDLVRRKRRALEQLRAPLPGGDGVGDEDQRRGLDPGHRAGADERLARAAGQHDDSRSAVHKARHRVVLILPQVPLGGIEGDRMRRARRVSGEILRRPAQLDQLLLYLSAGPGLDLVAVDRRTRAALVLGEEQQGRDALGPDDLAQHRGIRRPQDECAVFVSLDHEPTVTTNGLGDIDGDTLRYGELGVLLECVEHVLGGMAGGTGVPEAEPGDPIGVDMLGCALKFGEYREVVAGILGGGVRDLEQHRAVALHDQGSRQRIHLVSLGHAGGWSSGVAASAMHSAQTRSRLTAAEGGLH